MGFHSQSVQLLFLLLLACAGFPRGCDAAGASRPGGAGHALQFNDHVLLKTDFKDFPSTAMTFEAWISTSDFCHAGTIMSYAKDSHAKKKSQQVSDFNHFVIFDPRNLLACHDYEYIDLEPDTDGISCHAAFAKGPNGSPKTANYVERGGQWHHLAVTWDAEANGLTTVYMDGLLMASAITNKTDPLVPNGAFMLGGEQDCFGGCTDPSQGYHGLIDEVRIWRKARPQSEILKTMRWISGFERDPDLIAWWQFNEPGDSVDHGHFAMHKKALDASGHGNDLSLITEPQSKRAQITAPDGTELSTGMLQFRNNFALQKEASNMPADSFTVEFWARGGAVGKNSNQQISSTLFSYATESVGRGKERTGFLDDALRIERLTSELAPSWITHTSTIGAIALHLNSNEHTDSADGQSFVYFDAGWTDDKWHHIAATWDSRSGAAALYFDGKPTAAIWKSQNGASSSATPDEGVVDPILSPMSQRGTEGSVVLAQDQDCFGGCFSSSDGFKGDMAAVRVWGRALGIEEVGQNMARARPESNHMLSAMYVFDSEGLRKEEGGTSFVVDRSGSGNHLELRSAAPQYVYSTAPLSFSDGRIVSPPRPGGGGYSLALNDKQVLLATDFQNFPSTAITVEFWMLSTDTCRPGVPFSYAAGDYAKSDNSFLLFNYNSWGVSVMEDEGTFGDHLSGVSSTDGSWHHIAVTWDSRTGKVVLYDNGRPQWITYRGKGRSIPSGGTLVIGREQDCTGGCFDSASGAAGRTSEVKDQEYGAQDFFGIIEEMRVWSVARSPDEIRAGMEMDDGRGPGGLYSPGVDPSTPGLVAYWKFDEGAGYLVHDATGNSHHLSITQPPKWEVTRWLSTCGNAVVEGEEQCDDGDLTDGDGCSATCMIEPGWTCSHSPSKCHKKADPPPPHVPEPKPKPSPRPSPSPPPRQPDPAPRRGTGERPSDAPSSKKKKGSTVAALLSVFGGMSVLAVLIAVGLVTKQRTGRVVPEALLRAGSYVSDRVLSALPITLRERLTGYSPLSTGLYFAPNEDMQAAPDFMAFSSGPQRYQHMAPGAPGPYVPINSSAKPSDGTPHGRRDGGENALV